MTSKISAYLRQRKIKVIKPFSVTTDNNAVRFTICGFSESVSHALFDEFQNIDQVEIVLGDILCLSCDALVSPANSFGEMSGGLDKAIDNFYKGRAQKEATKCIRNEFLGELPVGHAITINMNTDRFPFLLIAPTMRIPGSVSESTNAYLAMRGLLVAIAKHNSRSDAKISSVAIPSLCTGVGGMNEKESARQMKNAFDNVVMSGWESVKHPAMAPYNSLKN